MTTAAPLTITLLGTGSPLPDQHRAGPATLISGAGSHFLVDAGRGVLMRLAATGVGVGELDAVLLTHLHSDHITDLNDVITSRWVMTFEPTPLTIYGPTGTAEVVGHILASLKHDIGYRLAHHQDLAYEPPVSVVELTAGPVAIGGPITVRCAPTDHRPVDPTVGYRFELDGASVVTAGDTVPCGGLDDLCRDAGALVHTVLRKDIVSQVPIQRMQDTLDYHSSPQEAGQTAQRCGVDVLVLTHYVPGFPAGDKAAAGQWHDLAQEEFKGTIEVGDDLHRVEVWPK